MRLAGTARQYSKNAMPQLTGITIHSATPGKRNWPYHANVMNTFEQSSSIIGSTYAQLIAVLSGHQFCVCAVGSDKASAA